MTTAATVTSGPDTQIYDAIVIGAGQAGGPLATALGAVGKRTAIIEREHVGGTCINEGCTPTKTMVASARDAYLVRRSADYGVHPGASDANAGSGPTPLTVDMARVRQRKRDIVESFRSGSERSLRESANVDVLMGEASFMAPHTLDVRMNTGETRRLSAPLIVVNTGERPSIPPVSGLADVPYLTSTSIMELDSVPQHLVVLGGGYIALEFGQMFRRFGAQVTILQRGPRLLSREDADVADAVADILREDGIDVRLNTAITRVERSGDGRVSVVVRNAEGGEETISGSHLLAALGRTPNTDRLNPAAGGIETNQRGYIRVNERLATTAEGVYAVGDVKGGPAFTHISYDDFRILRANLIEGKDLTTSGRFVPYTMYIDPQLGGVGLREQEARAQGRDIRVAKMPMSYVARALEVDETRGFMKAIVDAQSDQILGFTALGIEGGEIMSAVEIAMMGKLPYTTLRDATFAHPTLMESLNNLFGSFEGE